MSDLLDCKDKLEKLYELRKLVAMANKEIFRLDTETYLIYQKLSDEDTAIIDKLEAQLRKEWDALR